MAFTTLYFSFFIIIITAVNLTAAKQSDRESECAGRWIYVRNLPSRFNLDLLETCSQYPLFSDFCLNSANHGLGPKTHNRSGSWYRTDPYMLELIFHRRILQYPCLTADPDSATAVFLPYYAAIDSLRYLYGSDINASSEHGLDLYRFLRHDDSQRIWGRNFGHDHFMVMARPAWDFSQPPEKEPPIWGTSFLELPEFYNVTALTLESRPWPAQEQAIPYPTSFHPPDGVLMDSWAGRVRRSRRTTLMLFAGSGGSSTSPNIRRSIRQECDNSTTNSAIKNGGIEYSKLCEFVDCSDDDCEHDPIRFINPMLKSSFCLQPPGDTPTRRSTFDAIIAGCIPVFFEEQSAKLQYGWHLPQDQYEEFSVFIPKQDVVFKGLRISDVLMSIPIAEITKIREKLVEIMPRVMYRNHGNSIGLMRTLPQKDAFDIAIQGTLQRIKSKLR